MKSIGFSEHGNILSWYNKKKYAESKGLKFIFGVETYVTKTLDEKIRDNYHIVLIARNHEGFKEISKLVSQSSNRETNNFYYSPRVVWEDIKNTSDNVIVTSACLAGMIGRLHKSDDKKFFNEVLQWYQDNNHRAFFEVQLHHHQDQIELNKLLSKLSRQTGVRLIAGTDTHALNLEYDKARKILQKSKKIQLTDEDSFDLSFQDYDSLLNLFKLQEALSDSEITEAIENTNVMADMVEAWDIDYSKKYPQLYDNPEEVFEQKIIEGIKYRGVDKLPMEQRKVYAERIQHETDVYKANDAINFLLLDDYAKVYARKNGKRYGFGRGSVSGSIIAYLMRLTEMDSIKRGLNFSRFMSKERISLADIDTDWCPSEQAFLQDFLISHPSLSSAHIITFNTIALLGSIRDMGKGLEMPQGIIDEISSGIEDNEQYYRELYPELFHYVDLVQGTVTSVGSHPAGVCVSPIPLDENMGTMWVVDSKTKELKLVTQINMKEVDAQNFVKLDMLALDTVEVLSQTVDFAGIEWESITPDYIDIEDEKVWDSILQNNLGVFQYESDFAWQIYKSLFNKETISKIRARNPKFSYMDLLSLGNAILRPSGASYRADVMLGNFYDNGHEALNEFLSPTLGRMVYQEQIIQFLQDFCGYSGGESDIIRRAIGKKDRKVIENTLPEIKQRFIDTMINQYNTEHDESERIAEPFMQVIIDSSDYGFSINHSDAYSYLGYACAWLRFYYPIEFVTASLNVYIGKESKTNNLVEYAKSLGIEIKPIKFRYSRAGYMFDKESNTIYQGIESIKFMNAESGESLYKLKYDTYSSFTDLLIAIKDGGFVVETGENVNKPLKLIDFLKKDMSKEEVKEIAKFEKEGRITTTNDSIQINSRQIKILISLNYFSEFGGNKKLLDIYEFFDNTYKVKLKLKTKRERYVKVLQFENEQSDKSLSLIQQCESELDYLGHIITVADSIERSRYIVLTVKQNKVYATATAYQFATGTIVQFKAGNSLYNNVPFDVKDVISVIDVNVKPKSVNIGGKWTKSSTEKDIWIRNLKMIRKHDIK